MKDKDYDIPDMQTVIDHARAEWQARQQRQSPPKQTRKSGKIQGNVNRIRWAMFNRLADKHMKALPVQALACWVALFRHADGSGSVSRSHTTLAKDTGLSLKSIRKGLAALENSGLLVVKVKGNNVHGEYTVSCYKLEKQ